MNRALPDRMEPAEIVIEIASLHRDLEVLLVRLQGLSQSLYQRVRRKPADENTAIYIRFATTWSRFAGMAVQGAKRASAGDRILRGLASEPSAKESIARGSMTLGVAASTPVESLLDMYGEHEELEDARKVASGDASESE